MQAVPKRLCQGNVVTVMSVNGMHDVAVTNDNES